MQKLIWVSLMFIAGVMLPIQAALNARLGKMGNNALYAATISFIVGTIALILYIIITRQQVSWPGISSAPKLYWIGGLLGAFYVSAMIVVFPKLGPSVAFGLTVAAQMSASLLMSHYNILGSPHQPINLIRVFAVVMIVVGVVLLDKF